MSTCNSGTPYEREPLLTPTTPPPAYYNSLNTEFNTDIPPPSYQQSNRPKNRYLGPPLIRGPSDHKTLVAIVYFCCFLSPTTWIALYYSARAKEHVNNWDNVAAQKASKQTCYWSTATLIIGWVMFLILIAMATFVLTCYKLHRHCGVFPF